MRRTHLSQCQQPPMESYPDGYHTPIAVSAVVGSRGLVDFAYSTVPRGPGKFLDLVSIAMSVGFLENGVWSARCRIGRKQRAQYGGTAPGSTATQR